VPEDVVKTKIAAYMRPGKPVHLPARQNNTEFSIVRQYTAEFRGIAEYYALAHNRDRLSQLRWVMETSLTKTLSAKLKLPVPQVIRRFRVTRGNNRERPTNTGVNTVAAPGPHPPPRAEFRGTTPRNSGGEDRKSPSAAVRIYSRIR